MNTATKEKEPVNAVAKHTEAGAVATIAAPSQLYDIISAASRDPSVDVVKLKELVGMAREEQAGQAKKAFGVAMMAAQEAMKHVRTDANNPQTKSKYATYGALDKVIRPIYTKHGFALTFDTGEGAPADHVRVLCEVFHEAGHTRTYHFDIPADGKGAKGGDVMTRTHAAGAAMSYGQRYLLKAIFNIVVGDDDDGNAASGNNAPLSDEQRDVISDLIERSGTNIEKFCEHMGIDSVSALTQMDYPNAITALNTKLFRAQKKAGQ